MSGAAQPIDPEPSMADSLFNLVRHLDEDELWKFVCLMHPTAEHEELEDVFDVLVSERRSGEPELAASDVFAEEDRRRQAAE